MSKNELSKLRSLLTSRGDFWDLRWDTAQLERAWRNEVVTIPFAYHPAEQLPGEGRERGSFVSCLTIPHAKVYMNPRNVVDSDRSQKVHPTDPKRYQISVRILAIEGVEPPHDGIRASVFIVKGNPLILSTSPLPCFSSGIDSVTLDLRSEEEVSDLSLQVIAKDMDCHFAVSVEEIIEYTTPSSAVTKTMTMWQTQTGSMYGSCSVIFKIDRDNPLSVSELVGIRKSHAVSPMNESSPVDLLVDLRKQDGPLVELEQQKVELLARPARRRRGGAAATTNFALVDDLINAAPIQASSDS